MNQEQRDNMQIEMRGDIKVLVSQGIEHHETLYGNDGVVASMILLKERQDQCPARQASTVAGKRLGIAYIMIGVAVIGIIVSIAIVLHSS